MPLPSVPPPTAAYLQRQKALRVKEAARPLPYMASAAGVVASAAAVDVEAPVVDAATGWPVVQPDPNNPAYVSMPERARVLLCPEAFSCGVLCARLPLYLCLGLVITPLLLIFGVFVTVALLLILILVMYPCGVGCVYCFPRGWPGFSPPETLVWKAAKLLQSFRACLWQYPAAGTWQQSNLAEKMELSTGLLPYAIAIQVPLAEEDELATTFGRTKDVPPTRDGPPVQSGLGSHNPLWLLDQNAHIDEMAIFKPGEDPVAYLMGNLRCGAAPFSSDAPRPNSHARLSCAGGFTRRWTCSGPRS